MIGRFRIFPRAASTIAPHVDAIFWVLFGLSTVIVIGVAGTIIYFVARYNNAPIAVQPFKKTSRRAAEYTWTLIPLMAFLAIFAWGAFQYFEMHVAPANSMNVFVVGKQWMWKFQHSNGIREINTLHIPVGKPIRLIMASQDVIHSLFVPAFRIKQDIVPGRYTYLWFQATIPGKYRLFCTQYCGFDHTNMTGVVVVMKPQDYARWVETRLSQEPKLGPVGLAARGGELFQKLRCVSCHGGGKSAPDLRGLYLSRVALDNGQSVIADNEYIRESITNPSAKIVKGYRDIMPTFQGEVTEQELFELISYIKSLQKEKSR